MINEEEFKKLSKSRIRENITKQLLDKMKSKVGYTISELENLVEGKNLKNIKDWA